MFGAAVKEAMAGRDYREEARRLRIHPGTLYLLARGEGSAELVAKVARGLGQDPGRWLKLAGYEGWVAFEIDDPPTDRIRETARTLTYDADLENVSLAGFCGSNVPREDVETLDRLYRAFLTEQRQKQGRE